MERYCHLGEMPPTSSTATNLILVEAPMKQKSAQDSEDFSSDSFKF